MDKFTVEQFKRFYNANPHITLLLIRTLRKARNAGRKSYSLKTVWYVIRWQIDIANPNQQEFKLNDKFQSLFSRLVAYMSPDLNEFFEMRQIKWDCDQTRIDFEVWMSNEFVFDHGSTWNKIIEPQLEAKAA